MAFEDVEGLAVQSACLSPSTDSRRLSVTPVPSFASALLVQGREAEEGAKVNLRHHCCLPAQYFVLRFVVQLFTFRLLTFLSLVTEITLTVPWWHEEGVLLCRRPLHGAWWAGLQGSQGGWHCWWDVHGPVTGRTQRHACCLLSLWGCEEVRPLLCDGMFRRSRPKF